MKLLAPRLEPVGTADLSRIHAPPPRLDLAVAAEILISLELMPELAGDELDHDRIVEESEDRHAVGDEILRIREIRDGGEDVTALGLGQREALIADHRDHALEPIQALDDEMGRVGGARIGEIAARSGQNLRLGELAARGGGRGEQSAKVGDVLFVELEMQFEAHA